MTDAAHHAGRSRKLGGVVLAAAVALVVPLTVVTSAQGAPGGGRGGGGGTEPTATSVRIDSVLDEDAVLPTGTPGVQGLAYVVAREDFTVRVSFLDGEGEFAPLSWTKDVDLTLLVDGAPLATIPVRAEYTSAAFEDQVIAEPGSGLRMTVRADTKPKGISSPARAFDVLIADEPVSARSRASIGGDPGTDGCSPVTLDPAVAQPGSSVCADLLPPSGGFTSPGTLSQGVCGSSCEDSYVQALVALPPNRVDPATLVMKCDKDECGVGPIRRQTLQVNLSPEGANAQLNQYMKAEPCPAKGVVGVDQDFCIDYVQSTRSNAGDTFLFLLFVVDAKVRFL